MELRCEGGVDEEDSLSLILNLYLEILKTGDLVKGPLKGSRGDLTCWNSDSTAAEMVNAADYFIPSLKWNCSMDHTFIHPFSVHSLKLIDHNRTVPLMTN